MHFWKHLIFITFFSRFYLANRWRVYLTLLLPTFLSTVYEPFDVSFQKNFNTDCLCIRLGVILFYSSRFEKW